MEDRLNRKRRGCAIISAPSLVSKVGGGLVIAYVLDTKSYRKRGRIHRGYGGEGGWKIGRWSFSCIYVMGCYLFISKNVGG